MAHGWYEPRRGSLQEHVAFLPAQAPPEGDLSTVDELQCLVETVSEYLAEKEEEISSWEALPQQESRNHGLPVQEAEEVAQAKQAKAAPAVEEEKEKEKEKSDSRAEAFSDVLGMKDTAQTFFSFLTEKVSSGKTLLTSSMEKFVSEVPVRDSSNQPHLDVEAESRPDVGLPEEELASLPEQSRAKVAGAASVSLPEASDRDDQACPAPPALDPPADDAEGPFQKTSAAVSSLLGVFSSLKTTLTEKKEPKKEATKEGAAVAAGPSPVSGAEAREKPGEDGTEPRTSPLETREGEPAADPTGGPAPSASSSCAGVSLKAGFAGVAVPGRPAESPKVPSDGETPPEPLALRPPEDKPQEGPKEGSPQPSEQRESPAGFFSPLKKCFSLLPLSAPADPPARGTSLGLGKQCKSEDDVRKASSASSKAPSFPFPEKLQVSFLGSFSFSDKPQENKGKQGFFSSFLKAAPAENSEAPKEGPLGSNPEVPQASPPKSPPEHQEELKGKPGAGPWGPGSGPQEEGATGPSERVERGRRGHRGLNGVAGRGAAAAAAVATAPSQGGSALNPAGGNSEADSGVGRGRTLADAQEGFFPGLFRSPLPVSLSSKEGPEAQDSTAGPKDRSPGLLSGLFPFSSGENPPPGKVEKPHLSFLGGLGQIFGKNAEETNSKVGGSPVAPQTQEGTKDQEGAGSFLKNLLHQAKEKVEERVAQAAQVEAGLPGTGEESIALQAASVPLSSPQKKTHLSTKPALSSNNTEPRVPPGLPHENLGGLLRSSSRNADLLNWPGEPPPFEETRSGSPLERDYNPRGDPAKTVQASLPLYYVLNRNPVSWDEVLTWSESSNAGMDLCKRDGSASPGDWRPSEKFDPAAIDFNVVSLGPPDFCLGENETWAAPYLNGSLSPHQFNCILEDGPIDLSRSSAYGTNMWTLIDQEALYMEDPWLLGHCPESLDWLVPLLQGVWWPSEDGDYGYYIYTDGQYVYSLLTDSTGQFVYICTSDIYPHPDSWEDSDLEGSWQRVVSEGDLVSVCGFKVPLEDELFWLDEEEEWEGYFVNKPLDLSVAFQRRDKFMNVETFSQVLEESAYHQKEKPLDFSGYGILQRNKGAFRPEEKREGSAEDASFDLRPHFRMAPGGGLKEEFQAKSLDVAPRTSISESQQAKPSGLQIFKAAPKSDLPPVSLAEAETAKEDEKGPSNKVFSSWLSALGGLMGQGSGKDVEMLEDAAEKDQGPRLRFPATPGTPARKKGEAQPEPLPVSTAQEEAAVALPPTQNRAPLRRSASPFSRGLTSDTVAQPDINAKAAAGSLGEPENTWPALSQIAAKAKETLSKSDLKTGGPGEGPLAPAEPGLLGLLKMQGSKPPSQPRPTSQPHQVKSETQGQAEPPGAPSFFGSIRGFFTKEPAPSPSDSPFPALSNGQVAQALAQEPSMGPASEVGVSSEPPGAGGAKEGLFPKEQPPQKAREKSARVKEAPPAEAEQAANSLTSPAMGRHSPPPEEGGLLRSLSGLLGDSAARKSSSLSSSWFSLLDKGQPGASPDKVQPEAARQQPPEEPGPRLPFGLSQAAPPKPQQTAGSWAISSLFPASKKAAAPAPAPVPSQTARGPEPEGLFKIPFAGKKGLPHSSSFFRWAAFSPEEPPPAPDRGPLAKPPPWQGKEEPLPGQSASADAGVGTARKPVVEEKGPISGVRDAVLGTQEADGLQDGAREASTPVAEKARECALGGPLTASPSLQNAKQEDQPDPACEGPGVPEEGTCSSPEVPEVPEWLPQSPTEREETEGCLSEKEAAPLPDGNEALENTEPPGSSSDQRRAAVQGSGQEVVPEPPQGLGPPSPAGAQQAQGQEPLPKVPLEGELDGLKAPEEATSNKSVLDSSVETFSSFFTKMKPTKTFSDFLGSPRQAPGTPNLQKKSASFLGSAFQQGGPPSLFTGSLFGFSKGAAEQPPSKASTPSKPPRVDSEAKGAAGSVPGKEPLSSTQESKGARRGQGSEAGPSGQEPSVGPEETEARSVLKEDGLLSLAGEALRVDLEREASRKPDACQEPNALDSLTSEKSQGPEGGQVDLLTSDEMREADTCAQVSSKVAAAESVAMLEEAKAATLEEEEAGPATQKQLDLEPQTGSPLGQEGWGNTPGREAEAEDNGSQPGMDESPAVKAQANICPPNGGESLGAAAETAGKEESPDLHHEGADSVRDVKPPPVEQEEVPAPSEKPLGVEALGGPPDKEPAGGAPASEANSATSVFEMLSRPPWRKFGFGSSSSSSIKPMGSFFSPAACKTPRAEPGLRPGLGSVSSALFGGGSDEKGEKTGSLQETVFGRKLDFSLPWQKGPKEKEAKKGPSSGQGAPCDGSSGLEPSGSPQQPWMGAGRLGGPAPESSPPPVQADSSGETFLGARTAPAAAEPGPGLELGGPGQEEGLRAVPGGPPAPTLEEEEGEGEEDGDTASIPGQAEQKDGVTCPEEEPHVAGPRPVEESSPRPPLKRRPVAKAAHKWRRPVHLWGKSPGQRPLAHPSGLLRLPGPWRVAEGVTLSPSLPPFVCPSLNVDFELHFISGEGEERARKGGECIWLTFMGLTQQPHSGQWEALPTSAACPGREGLGPRLLSSLLEESARTGLASDYAR
ncbi:uncharacterized protein LOC113423545 [Notechis scutatus]|uniref:Uncharacterized protein LOC113423545 n=1 Tax=Notechis scutatus TaxID=8663 RepID=A0A6J1VLB5_9SAUR|nr:uncharacterized protein LOC113423545 [Notechis scutatus]